MTASVWSAIAATCSAISVFFLVMFSRWNVLESVRPELVLTDWKRWREGEGEAQVEFIGFEKIKNVGRGVAIRIWLDSAKIVDDRPLAVLSTTGVPILAVDDEVELNGRIMLWWENVAADKGGHKLIVADVSVSFSDSMAMRHETKYTLIVHQRENAAATLPPLAPGVMLASRTSTARPEWRINLRTKATSFLRRLSKRVQSVIRIRSSDE